MQSSSSNANASSFTILRRSFFFAGAIVFTLSVACSDSDGDYDRREDLQKEVIFCEEAFARLDSCCPNFDPLATGGCVERTYQTTDHGCEGYYSQRSMHHMPALSRTESECIRELACADLIKNGICERAQNAPARSTGSYTTRDPHSMGPTSTQGDLNSNHPPVCP